MVRIEEDKKTLGLSFNNMASSAKVYYAGEEPELPKQEAKKEETKPKGTCSGKTVFDNKGCRDITDANTCKNKKNLFGVHMCNWKEGFQNRNDTENFENKLDVLTMIVDFEPADENNIFEVSESVVLSELSFYVNQYEGLLSDDQVKDATDLLGNLGEINNGLPCGWHYDKETGQAGGYFSDILNDTDWQTSNPELYASLSKYVCPSYLPVCTGQRTTGIVPGKCVTFKENCNNKIVDDIMGYERVDYSTVKRKTDETIKYENIIQNLANREVLTDTIEKLKDVLENPSIETFENENNDLTIVNFT